MFGGVRALDDVSFEVGRGEMHCLAGENGCGKSTPIKIITGVCAIASLAIKIGRPVDAISTLSGGNQQRVALAKWLAAGPKLLILDSPTVGVDVGARAGIYKIVRDLAAQGLAILMISDEVSEVYFNTDRILHMAGGRTAGEIDPRAATLHQLEEAVYA